MKNLDFIKLPNSDNAYAVNLEKRTVVFRTKSHGNTFYGVSKCLKEEMFDAEKGFVIAQIRATIEQRRHDLRLTREFIETLKMAIDDRQYYMKAISPHYMRSLQAAKEEEKAQLAHIRDLNKRLKEYTR